MSETLNKPVEEMAAPVEVVAEKPYKFRTLDAPDIFPMFRIISKIGLKEFTAAIDKDTLKDLVKSFTADKAKEGATAEEATAEDGFGAFAVGGATVILGIAEVILSRLPNCENDIYKLLAQVSGLSVDEIRAFDLATFTEMVIDFIKKEEFKDFIKVVSRSFK